MPHNWTLTAAAHDPEPPIIRAGADGALYVQHGGSHAVVIQDGISWVAEERPFVGAGEDAYPALELFFRHVPDA